MKPRIAIFISGRGSNMEAIVHESQSGCLKDRCEIALVFSNNPAALGLKTADSYGLTILSLESRGRKREDFDTDVCRLLEPFQIDYIVLAGYMRIVSPVLVKAYHKKIINIHPADTALFRGIGAYEWAFSTGQTTTAVTVHYVDEGVDTGEVIAKHEYSIEGVTSLHELERLGLSIEHKFYSETLAKIFEQSGSRGDL